MEKTFIIAEIEALPLEFSDFKKGYRIARTDDIIYLPDDAVIPASRLRYGMPKVGETYLPLLTNIGLWVKAKTPLDMRYLILDPPAPVDDFEKWVEEAPEYQAVTAKVIDTETEKFKAWLRRMPRRNP